MKKSALITEKINIQLHDVKKESRGRFYDSKKNGVFPLKPNTQPLKMRDQVQSGNGRKVQPLSLVTQC